MNSAFKKHLPPMTGTHIAFVVGALACHTTTAALLVPIGSTATITATCIFLCAMYNLWTGADIPMFITALAQVGALIGFGIAEQWSTFVFLGAGFTVFGAMQLTMAARLMRRQALTDPTIISGFGITMATIAGISLVASGAPFLAEPLEAESNLLLGASILTASTALVVPVVLIRRQSVRN